MLSVFLRLQRVGKGVEGHVGGVNFKLMGLPCTRR
jgi:hypothetical protein